MSKITIGQLEEISTFSDEDVLPIYNKDEGTKKITGENIKKQLLDGIDLIQSQDIQGGSFVILQEGTPKSPKTIPYGVLKDYIIGDESGVSPEEVPAKMKNVYGYGTQITDNSDLNNYIELGRYYNNNSTATIAHYPASSAMTKFNMTVEQIMPEEICQTVRPIDTYVYAKRIIPFSEAWIISPDTTYDSSKTYYQAIARYDSAFATAATYSSSATYYSPALTTFTVEEATGTDEFSPTTTMDAAESFNPDNQLSFFMRITFIDSDSTQHVINISEQHLETYDQNFVYQFTAQNGFHQVEQDQEIISQYITQVQVDLNALISEGYNLFTINNLTALGADEMVSIGGAVADLGSAFSQITVSSAEDFEAFKYYFFTFKEYYSDSDHIIVTPADPSSVNPSTVPYLEIQRTYDFTNGWSIMPELVTT